jgi:hypothetical protein
MTSAINPDNPVHGNPTTQSVRDNFQIAAQEITDLQAVVSALLLNFPYLPLGGATMTGPLMLVGDPAQDAEAATKLYVDALQALIDAQQTVIDGQASQIADLESRVAALENPPLIARR